MRNQAASVGSSRHRFILVLMMFLSSALHAQFEPGHPPERPAEKDSEQNQTKPKPKPAQVSLGDSSGRPGESVLVSAFSAPGDGPKLRRLELNIVYPSGSLKFDKVNKSPEDKWKNVEVSVEDFTTRGEGRTESSTLVIEASLMPGASPDALADGIPQGVFGKLAFHIDDDADGDIVDLLLTAEATAVGENSPLPEDTLVTDGSIVYILAPGNFPGCFFFTH